MVTSIEVCNSPRLLFNHGDLAFFLSIPSRGPFVYFSITLDVTVPSSCLQPIHSFIPFGTTLLGLFDRVGSRSAELLDAYIWSIEQVRFVRGQKTQRSQSWRAWLLT